MIETLAACSPEFPPLLPRIPEFTGMGIGDFRKSQCDGSVIQSREILSVKKQKKKTKSPTLHGENFTVKITCTIIATEERIDIIEENINLKNHVERGNI